jgi:hypothetical protein
MTLAAKFFPIVSLAWNRGNPLWLLGLRAWQGKSEKLFLIHCFLFVDNLRPLARLHPSPRTRRRANQTKPNQSKMKTEQINRNLALRTRAGLLTDFALSCGYLETRDGVYNKAILWKDHGAFHVRLIRKRSGVALYWESYDTLKESRDRLREWEGSISGNLEI